MKTIGKRILCYSCLAVASAGLLFYAANAAKENAEPNKSYGFGEDSLVQGSVSSDQSADSDDVSPSDTPPTDLTEVPTVTAAEYLASDPFAANSDEYTLSDGVYDAESYRLVNVTPDGETFFDKATYAVTYENDDGSVASYRYFTMWPRMGFIIAADENGRRTLNAEGREILFPDDFSMVFFGERDAQGRPIFKEWRSDTLYAVEQDGSYTETTYDPRVDFRGVDFDYPSYYGVSDDPEAAVVATRNGFGYSLADGKSVGASYEKAFAYSEGYGCAYDSQNRLYFFNSEGRLRIAGLASVVYGCGDNNGETALGYYYFDEGLTRVSKRSYVRGELVSSYETLIDRKGNEFALPADYSLYSYSCGRLLLEKDGFAGYMTPRGKFICDPIYTYARPFFEGLAVVGNANGKKGLIDRDGNFVIPQIFDEITDCSGGVICLYDKSCGWQILNKVVPVSTQVDEQPSADAIEDSDI